MKHRTISLQAAFLCCAIWCLLHGALAAQNPTFTVKGKVTDAYHHKLQDVMITSSLGSNQAQTNAKGEFVITISDGSPSLLAQLRGYRDAIVALRPADVQDYLVVLETDVSHRDEKVDVGYFSQRRQSLVGAVSTISGEELEKAPVANLGQALAGHLPGLIVRQSYSELSRETTNLFSRGINSNKSNGPLAIIDGVLVSHNVDQSLQYITPSEIESITYLKDASTLALYGIQGAHGLLVIRTKRGAKGGLQITGRLDKSYQQATTKPIQYSSYDYALMRNQAGVNDGKGEYFWYTQKEIEGYKSGEDRTMYPNHNWYKTFIRDWTAMERASLNFSGGSQAVQFFSNVNFMHQGGVFKTDQVKYNPNANNVWVNFRSNVDMKLSKALNGFVRLSGNIKRERTPGSSVDATYQSLFMLPPTLTGPLTPVTINSETGVPTATSDQVVTTDRIDSPTYGMLNRSGYTRHTVTNINAQFGLNLDMSFLTKGLSASGLFVFQTNSVGSLNTKQDYERYVRTSNRNELIFQKKGAQLNSPLAYSKSGSYYYHLSHMLSLDYGRAFGKHKVNGMGYFFYQSLERGNTDSPALLPYNRVSAGFNVNYGYDDRYFLQASLGISGSEQYSKASRYTNTPSLGAAWVISNESFLKDSRWLTYAKVRGVYGISATDRSGLGRYTYKDNISISNSGRVGYLQYTVNENSFGNPYLRAEKVRQTNLGVDLGFFHQVSFSFDLFREKMDNMIVDAVSNTPAFQGIPLGSYPRTNSGILRNKGYEVSLQYSKTVAKDLRFSIGGYYAANENEVVAVNESVRSADYSYPRRSEGFTMGQQFGYLVDYSNGNGFFNTAEELKSNTIKYTMGTPRLGDLKYTDLNGDGTIDSRDQAPIGSGSIPNVTYGLNGSIAYKNFDLSVLFHGFAKYKQPITGDGVFENGGDGLFSSLHQKAWTAGRYQNGEEILYPALSAVTSVNHQTSDFFVYDRAFLRLKNVELGYTLPEVWSKGIKADRVRILLSGQNLAVWQNMKTKDFGPEGGYFKNMPVYRVFNVGVKLTF